MKNLVLVVEDSTTNQAYLKDLLENNGLTVEIAECGDVALEKSERLRPDLILLDVVMPEPDGFEVCQKLKLSSTTSEIPIIFLTSMNQKEHMIKGFALGAVDYVNKPFNKEELISRVFTHLELKHSRDTIEEQKAKLKLQNRKLLNHSNLVEEFNQKLNEKNKELEETIKTKDKFFSIISHDLKGPLGDIITFTDIILGGYNSFDKERTLGLIQELKNSTVSSTKLLKNLMQWARSQTGSFKKNPVKISIWQEVTDTLNLLQETAKLKKIQLKNNSEEGTYVLSDKEMLRTVIRNLVTNAIKFTNNGGTVEVRTSEINNDSQKFCKIEVIDTGVGIYDDQIDRLFHVGTNRSTAGTCGEKGTGLGLILCKEFVEKNNGTIEVESKIGEGSSFIFTLPVYVE